MKPPYLLIAVFVFWTIASVLFCVGTFVLFLQIFGLFTDGEVFLAVMFASMFFLSLSVVMGFIVVPIVERVILPLWRKFHG